MFTLKQQVKLSSIFILFLFVIGYVQCVESSNQSTSTNSRSKLSRQYSSSSYSGYASPSLFTNPVEGIIIGVLAICGLSLFGIPLLMMLANMFSLNGNTGIGIIPTATTSVNAGRRRKRSAGVNLLNDHLLQRAMETFNSFLKSEDKMQMLQRLIS